jgi:hypothetical protein
MRASYRAGIRWIAENDETMERDRNVIRDLISVQLLADLFGKEDDDIAVDVLKYRSRNKA